MAAKGIISIKPIYAADSTDIECNTTNRKPVKRIKQTKLHRFELFVIELIQLVRTKVVD